MPDKSLPEHQPKYQRVFEELRSEIIAGRYKAGQKIPSEAALVSRFGASRITVGHAVRDLCQQGLVERRAGSGTYVKAAPSQGSTGELSFGLLIPDFGRTDIFEPICQGMADADQASEHALLWCNRMSGDSGGTREQQVWQICQQYIARKVSGVFFTPLDFAPRESVGPEDRTNEKIMAAFETARIPVVLLDRDYLRFPNRSNHDLVGIDNWRTGFVVTEHLINLGSRRIIFLCSNRRSASSVEERIAGYREALFTHGFSVEPALVQRLLSEDEASTRVLMDSLKPDAIVCANDRTAGRLMQHLIALGLRVPDDVRVVGIDDIPYASLFPIPLTTMHQPCREIGIAAMETMLHRVNHPDMPPREVLLDCKLIVRGSCGAKVSAGTTG